MSITFFVHEHCQVIKAKEDSDCNDDLIRARPTDDDDDAMTT